MERGAQTESDKKLKRIYVVTTVTCIIFVVVVMIVSGLFAYLNQIELRENGSETTAIVTEIRRSLAIGGDTRLFVQYTVGGMVYQNQLRIAVRDAYVGEEVLIYYNPNNPNRITPVDRTRAVDTLGRMLLMPLTLSLMLAIGLTWATLDARYKANRAENRAKWGAEEPQA